MRLGMQKDEEEEYFKSLEEETKERKEAEKEYELIMREEAEMNCWMDYKKPYDNETCLKLWRRMRVREIYYFPPTVEQIEELYSILKKDQNSIYIKNYEDCKKKRRYWSKVLGIYAQNEFAMPYSHDMGYEKDAREISRYYINPSLIDKIEWICELLDKKAHLLYMMEH